MDKHRELISMIEDVECLAYRRGYEKGRNVAINFCEDEYRDKHYERGITEAIDTVKWLFLNVPNMDLFDGNFVEDILNLYTWEQITSEIEEYKKWEIKAGDEVEVGCSIGIVTRHKPNTDTCYVLYRDGSCGEVDVDDCQKTGNYSMKLDQWLEQMRKESHETDSKRA